MSEQTPNSVDLARQGTVMASYGTQLALDRTTLAWVRTALAMTSFGFGMVGFFRTLRQQNPDAETIRLHHDAIAMGTALIVMGIVALVLAGGSHLLNLRKLQRGDLPTLKQWPLSVFVAMLVVIVGLIGLWAFFAR